MLDEFHVLKLRRFSLSLYLQQSNMATHSKSEIEAYLGTVHISPQEPKD
jgi:hypothetical protein